MNVSNGKLNKSLSDKALSTDFLSTTNYTVIDNEKKNKEIEILCLQIFSLNPRGRSITNHELKRKTVPSIIFGELSAIVSAAVHDNTCAYSITI